MERKSLSECLQKELDTCKERIYYHHICGASKAKLLSKCYDLVFRKNTLPKVIGI